MKSRIATGTIMFLVLALSAAAFASGPLLFDKSEYAARRARLMEKIPDGVAILLGATPATGYGEFVQNNDMMYFANHPRYTPIIYSFGILFAVVMAVGFLAIPIVVFLRGGVA